MEMKRQRAGWVAVGVAVSGAIVAATVVLLASGETASRAAREGADRPQASKPASCRDKLLKDWSDGRIDGTYPVACYRTAIKELPTDLLVYSSAPEDLRQALSDRIVQSASAAEPVRKP
jgi:hypothetical protein